MSARWYASEAGMRESWTLLGFEGQPQEDSEAVGKRKKNELKRPTGTEEQSVVLGDGDGVPLLPLEQEESSVHESTN